MKNNRRDFLKKSISLTAGISVTGLGTSLASGKEGIKWTVVEGPPALGSKTKLGLEGRDEEISNFITFMKNLKQYGDVDIICYNWMPVISWARTNQERPGRGGALMLEFDYEASKG